MRKIFKRFASLLTIFILTIMSIVPVHASENTSAVSYTHLDVYKRQASYRAWDLHKRARRRDYPGKMGHGYIQKAVDFIFLYAVGHYIQPGISGYGAVYECHADTDTDGL